jgi:hypothetical protein
MVTITFLPRPRDDVGVRVIYAWASIRRMTSCAPPLEVVT